MDKGVRMPVRLGVATLLVLASGLSARGADDGDARVRDRYLSMAMNNPRRGPTVERLYQLSIQAEGIDALIERIETDATGEAKSPGWTLIGLLEETRGRDAEAIAAYQRGAAADPEAYYPRYSLGLIHLHRNDWDRAADSLLAALEITPPLEDAIEIRKALGRCYLRSRQFDKARETWTALAEMAPEDPITLEELTTLLVEEEQWDEALGYYERLRALHKDRPYQAVLCTIAMGKVEARRGRFEDALARFEEALGRIKPDSWLASEIRQRIQELFRKRNDLTGLIGYYEKRLTDEQSDGVREMVLLAELLVEIDRGPEARPWYERALELAPKSETVRLAYVRLLESEKDHAAAIEQYERMLEDRPNEIAYLEALGELHLQADPGDVGETKARQCWERIAESNPQDPATMVQVAEILVAHAMNDQASGYFDRAILLAPGVGQYREYKGEFLAKTDRRDEALAVFEEMAAGPRRSPETLLRLAEVLGYFDFNAEAIETSREAVALKPDDFEARMQLVELLADGKAFGDALTELNEAEKLSPNAFFKRQVVDTRIRLLMRSDRLAETFELGAAALSAEPSEEAAPYVECAKMALALGKTSEAGDFTVNALERLPGDVPVLELAARVYERASDYEKLTGVLKRLTELAPQNRSEYHRQLANCHARLGDREAALKAAEDVIAASPDNPTGYELLAQLCERFGMPDRSLASLAEALKVDPRNMDLRLQYARWLERTATLDEAIEQYWVAYDGSNEADEKLNVIRLLADAAYRADRFERVIDRLERARRTTRDDWIPLLSMAEAYRKIDDYSKAREILTELIARRPQETALLSQMVRLATAEGLQEEAVRHLQQLVKLEPSRKNLMRLAGLLHDLDRGEEALAVWRQAAKATGDETAAVCEVATELFEHQAYEPAIELMDDARERHPVDWQMGYLLGTVLMKAGRTADADELFVELADLPDLPQAPAKSKSSTSTSLSSYYSRMPLELVQAAKLWSVQSQLSRASRRYSSPSQRSTFLPPDLETTRIAAWYQHCQVAKQDDRFDELLASLKADNTARARLRIVETLFLQKQWGQELYEAARAVCEASPDDRAAKAMQFMIMADPRGRDTIEVPFEKAVTLFEQVVEGRPGLEMYLGSQWMMYLQRLNKTDECRAYAEKLAEADPTDPVRAMRAILSLASTGQFDTAMKMLRRVESQASSGSGRYRPSYIYPQLMRLALKEKRSDAAVRLLITYLRETRPKSTRGSGGAPRYYSPASGSTPTFPTQTAYYDASRLRAMEEFYKQAAGKGGAAFGWAAPGGARRPTRRKAAPASAPSDEKKETPEPPAVLAIRKGFEADIESLDEDDRIYAHLGLAYFDYWSDKKEDAADHVDQVVKLRPGDVSLQMSLASLRYDLGDSKGALDTLSNVRRRYHTTYKPAQQLVLRIARDIGDDETAKAAALRLFNMRLSSNEQLELARNMHDLGLTKKAEQIEHRLTATSSTNVDQLRQLMQQLGDRGNKKEAARLARQVLKNLSKATSNQDYYRRDALRVLEESGDLDDLIAKAEAQHAGNPKSLRVLVDLWHYYTAKKDHDKAGEAMEKALALRPSDLQLRLQYAKSLHGSKQGGEALAQYEVILDKDPGLLLGDAGNIWQFMRQLEQAKRLDQFAQLMVEKDWSKFTQTGSVQPSRLPYNLTQIAARLNRLEGYDPLPFLNKLNDYVMDIPDQEDRIATVVRLRADKLLETTKLYVKAWHLIGPFDNADRAGYDKAYPPETEPFDPEKTYPGKHGEVRWQPVRLDGRAFDAGHHDRKEDDVVAYAYSEITSSMDGEAKAHFGSDDGGKVWINGELVHRFDGQRPVRLDQDSFPVQLKRGTNAVLIKIDQVKGQWGFSFRVDITGHELEDKLRRRDALRYMVACAKGFEGFTPTLPEGVSEEVANRPLSLKTRPVDLMRSGGWRHPNGKLVSGNVSTFLDGSAQCGQLEPMRTFLEAKVKEDEKDLPARVWLAMIDCRLGRIEAIKAEIPNLLALGREQANPQSETRMAFGWLAQELEEREELIPLSVQCNELLVELMQPGYSGSMLNLLTMRMADSYARAKMLDQARGLYLHAARMTPDSRQGSYAEYEKQGYMYEAANALNKIGLYEDAHTVAAKLAKASAGHGHGEDYIRRGKDLARRIRKTHPEISEKPATQTSP